MTSWRQKQNNVASKSQLFILFYSFFFNVQDTRMTEHSTNAILTKHQNSTMEYYCGQDTPRSNTRFLAPWKRHHGAKNIRQRENVGHTFFLIGWHQYGPRMTLHSTAFLFSGLKGVNPSNGDFRFGIARSIKPALKALFLILKIQRVEICISRAACLLLTFSAQAKKANAE